MGDDGAASLGRVRRAVTNIWRRSDQHSDVEVIARRLADEARRPAERRPEGDPDR